MGNKVSILIPIFNSVEYIKETLDSVLNQTWKNIEIIIVDDGSSDGSYETVKSYESERLKVYRQANSGASSARNFAFANCTGDYIQYLDADDVLSANKIEEQMLLFERFGDNIIVSCSWFRFFDNIENIVYRRSLLDRNWKKPVDWLLNSWEGKGMAQTAVWLTPRRFIENSGGWNEQLSVNDDGEFFCRVLLNVDQIIYCSSVQVFYRSGLMNSLSVNNTSEKIYSLFSSYELYEYHILLKHDIPRVRRAIVKNYSNFVYMYYPFYPDLLLVAKNRAKKLGFENFIISGGWKFRFFASILGFNNALKFRERIKSLI